MDPLPKAYTHSCGASRSGAALSGRVRAPGDKSISHRALLFAALAEGPSEIAGLLESDDVLRLAAALRALGVEIETHGGVWRIVGGPWRAPQRALYLGNSGTGVRLLMGALAGRGLVAQFDGDFSLRQRPMGRVVEPLRRMGASIRANDGRLPVEIDASERLQAIATTLATPSAQVKSAIILAALGAQERTRIHEPAACRDHTERLLPHFGGRVTISLDEDGGRRIEIAGGQQLKGAALKIPGDPSSAAFLTVAALITPGSDILIENVLVNPLRIGLFDTLREMGADIVFSNRHERHGEPIANMRVRHSALHGVETPAARAPTMIDEFPILCIAAAFAQGETHMKGIGELRVKESDRVRSMEAGLLACGVDAASGDDWLRVKGGARVRGGARVQTNHDHRIAMSFLVMGCASQQPVEIDDVGMIATSYPDFLQDLRMLTNPSSK